MNETVPADIAAAIENVIHEAIFEGGRFSRSDGKELRSHRAALDAAILAHLRKADELKAALERIEQGV